MANELPSKTEKKPEPNIAFVGDEGTKPLVDVRAQGVHFKLPEDQSKPFYSEHMRFLVRNFQHLYKPLVQKKGSK